MGAVAGYFLYPLYGVYCAVGCVLAGFGLAASPEIKEKVSGYIAERKAKNEEKKKTEKKTTKQVAGPSRAAA
jgi:hypothetical protein